MQQFTTNSQKIYWYVYYASVETIYNNCYILSKIMFGNMEKIDGLWLRNALSTKNALKKALFSVLRDISVCNAIESAKLMHYTRSIVFVGARHGHKESLDNLNKLKLAETYSHALTVLHNISFDIWLVCNGTIGSEISEL